MAADGNDDVLPALIEVRSSAPLVVPAGSSVSHTTTPLALLEARKAPPYMLPPKRLPPSPMKSSVAVTKRAGLPQGCHR